jgi:hypothetical protein
MLRLLPGIAVILWTIAAVAQQPAAAVPLPDAAGIMARVAANQDRSESERAHYVYVQHARVASRTGKTVRCEEITDSRVTPSATGSTQQLLKLEGRVLVKHKYVSYTQLLKPGARDSDVNIDLGDNNFDRGLVEDIRNGLTSSKTKDGIGAGLFPLTSKSQADYTFHLIGSERMNGRDVYHLTFVPKDPNDFGWKGDAWIDVNAYQPVLVRTAKARNMPFAVRTLLGTSFPGLGFTVIYAPQPGEVWFPVRFGTEFKIHVLFLFNRQITLSAENHDFEQTHVDSKIIPVESADSTSPQP